MIEITAEIRAFIDKAAAGVELAEDEYIDLSDGLIHCKKCGGQRQTVVPCFGKSGYFMPRCICQCQQEAEEQRKAAEERQRRMERIKRRKAQGLQDRYLYDYTFANDNGKNPLMDKARAYVENWKEAYKSNIGLLLFGDVGTGKSFFAGCIANALLDQDVPVLMTNFPTILNRLTGMFSEDRSEFIASFDEYDLLIIDDLGVERSTEYAMEQMFFVIDSRYITEIWTDQLEEGVFPQTSNEALVTENAKQIMGVAIGDPIAVETPDGDKLNFTISGFMNNTASIMSGDSYGIILNTEDYCAIYPNVSDGEPNDYGIMFFTQFANTRNIQGKIADLKEQCNLSNEQISSNNNLLGLLGQSRVPFLLQVYLAAAVLFVLVMLAGIMMIASSLNSNVAQRTEFFGLMRCIGATPKQIMRLVRKEALSWCRLAIPVGISIGIVVIWVLCAILRFLSPEFFKAMSTFGFSVPSILAGIVVGLVTVLFAAYSPAKKAAKVSPLAAVSGNANDLEPARNAANTQLLKIDTALGIYHAKANRKNLFLMTSSFALSIILFLSFSVTVEFMQHTLTPLQPWTADLSIISPDNACAIDKALLDDLKENPVVDLAYGRKFAYEVPSVTNGIEKKMDLISYEQYQFDWAKDYLLEGSLESVQTDLGTGLIVYNSQNTIQIGDTVSLNTNGQSKEIQIVGMLSDCPFYSAAGVGTIICSEDTFEQITGESKYTVIDVQLVKGTTDEDVYVIRQMVDSSFTFADERMGNSSTMGTYYCFWLFIYGFLVLIAMITIFNIINSISMSVSARLKQYGAFRAIGVSMGQLSKMIVAEAFTYTIIGGVVGTVLGLFCNKLLFGMLISYRWGDAWTPPLPEVAVILLIVVSSVILAVHGPIKRIRNMSIVDTISAQ